MARFSALVLLVAAAAGCAGAPVQEMSNARQAIRAAEHAGANTAAPELMGEARQLLKSAESHLRRGEYRDARDEAELSRDKAVEARRVVEGQPPAPAPATTPPLAPAAAPSPNASQP